MSAWRRIVWEYGVAILAIAAGFAVRLFLAPVLPGRGVLSVLPAGNPDRVGVRWMGAGIFATVLGLLLGLFFVEDYSRAVELRTSSTPSPSPWSALASSWRGEPAAPLRAGRGGERRGGARP